MNVRVTRFIEGAREATGHAVIVDVFRAFTTAAFCVAAGAREIVLVADHEQAHALKRDDPSLFLTLGGIGEAVSGLAILVLRGRPLRWLLMLQAVGLLGICGLVTNYDPLLWFHFAGPLTKNVPLIVGTLVLLRHQQ